MALNDTLDKMNLTDIYRTFQPKEAKYTFFSNAHGTFSKIDHLIGHKTSLNKFKKIEIISSIVLDYNGLNLEANLKKKKPQKQLTSWRLNNMLLNNEYANKRSRKKSKSFWKQVKMNTKQSKIHGTWHRRSLEESS